MDAALVSPAERPTSCLPLKTTSVDWPCTLRARSTSFWLSKSTLRKTRSRKRGSAVSFCRIGCWARQVGHQGAVTSTRMGLPAACAASKGSLGEALGGSEGRQRRGGGGKRGRGENEGAAMDHGCPRGLAMRRHVDASSGPLRRCCGERYAGDVFVIGAARAGGSRQTWRGPGRCPAGASQHVSRPVSRVL